jgi:hypothetical protein
MLVLYRGRGKGVGEGEGDERMQQSSQWCYYCCRQGAGFEAVMKVTMKNTGKCKRLGEHNLQRAASDL